MQIKTLLVALVTASAAVDALTIPGGAALAIRGTALDASAGAAAVRLSARQNNRDKKNNAGKNNAAKNNGKKSAAECAAAKKLADGIEQNIKAQKGEQAAAAKIRTIVGKNAVDKKQFDAAKKELLANVNKGIEIRKKNQAIAPKGNAAIAGLGAVATAQATELTQSTGLKGNAQDLATLTKLATEFAAGIKQNEKNKADALKGCT